MALISVTCTPTAVTTNSVALSQSPGASAITLNGTLVTSGVATFSAAQKVRLTSGGNDSGITFTFIGTDADGNYQTETVAGTNISNSDTTKFFKTITSVTKSGASAGTIVIGNLIASVSPTLKIETTQNPVNFNLLTQLISGTATWGMDYTFDTPFAPGNLWIADGTVTAKSANFESSWTKPISGLRLNLTASSSGVVALKVVQAGV